MNITVDRPLVDTESEFENYQETSNQYDQTRRRLGMDFITQAIESIGPMDEQSLLDAGCGTGTYLEAFTQTVRTAVGVDLSQGMLDQAEEKFLNNPNVSLRQGSLVDLPCEDNEFNAITCNQVIHHLARAEGEDRFDRIQEFANEAFRALQPGGVLLMNTSSPEQIRDGFWWAALIPDAIEKMSDRTIEIPELCQILEDAGFRIGDVSVMKDELLQADDYLDQEGPLKKIWRDGDSAWSLVSEEELQGAMANVTQMNASDSMQSFQDNREDLRRQIGQTTSISAFVPTR